VRKQAEAHARLREADAALCQALDADGNGKISIGEFVSLSATTGMSERMMRQRFREKDLGNSGELTMEQMREVLQEMRDAGRAKREKAERAAAAAAADPALAFAYFGGGGGDFDGAGRCGPGGASRQLGRRGSVMVRGQRSRDEIKLQRAASMAGFRS
jgi:hypothetical protein